MAKTPPCEGCKIACTNYKRCGKYREWLRETWREVQALYAEQERGADREGDTE